MQMAQFLESPAGFVYTAIRLWPVSLPAAPVFCSSKCTEVEGKEYPGFFFFVLSLEPQGSVTLLRGQRGGEMNETRELFAPQFWLNDSLKKSPTVALTLRVIGQGGPYGG